MPRSGEPRPGHTRFSRIRNSTGREPLQNAFQANPDYALWYGWSEMVRDLADIRELAADLRAHQAD